MEWTTANPDISCRNLGIQALGASNLCQHDGTSRGNRQESCSPLRYAEGCRLLSQRLGRVMLKHGSAAAQGRPWRRTGRRSRRGMSMSSRPGRDASWRWSWRACAWLASPSLSAPWPPSAWVRRSPYAMCSACVLYMLLSLASAYIHLGVVAVVDIFQVSEHEVRHIMYQHCKPLYQNLFAYCPLRVHLQGLSF